MTPRTEIRFILNGKDVVKSDVAASDTLLDFLRLERRTITTRLQALQDARRVELSQGTSCAILPAHVDDLAQVLLENPQATLVAGATDVGLWVTKFLRDISPVVFLNHLDDLKKSPRTAARLPSALASVIRIAGVFYVTITPILPRFGIALRAGKSAIWAPSGAMWPTARPSGICRLC